VEELEKVDFVRLPTLDPGEGTAELPTILLTHVPLYRERGTPCGPKRERWPPTTPPKGQTTPVFPDDRNAISLSGGYQYQNVLSEDDSVNLVSKVGNVIRVFSGDDHDYCEIVHPENKNHAREITVKAMSWAMGVRKPGFLMLSLWNPIDASGLSLHSSSGHGSTTQSQSTTESHLCLLPDQLGIFIRYLSLLVFTLLILIIRAILTPFLHLTPFSDSPHVKENELSLLPTTKQDIKRREEDEGNSSSNSSNNSQNLAPRSSAARTRSVSPAKGYGLPSNQVRFATPPLVTSYPNSNGNGSWGSDDFGKDKSVNAAGSGRARNMTALQLIWREASRSIWRVAWIVILVYLYLVYYG